jgi:hypothetical protein
MQRYKNAVTWVLIIIHVHLYGCASTSTRYIPDIHRLDNRSSDYPVGIISAHFPPKAGIDFVITGKGTGASAGAVGGVATCAELLGGGGEGSVLAFLLCAPIGAAVGAIGGAVTAPSADEVESAEDRMLRQLKPLAAQIKLAESVKDYFSSEEENLTIVIADELQGSRLEDADREFEPAELGTFRTILEVAVLEILFTGPGRKNTPACLEMKARATKWDGYTGKKLDMIETTYKGACLPVDTWTSEDGKSIITEIQNGYLFFTEAIVDELFLVYVPDVDTASLEQDIERKVPFFVLAPIQPRLSKDLYSTENIFAMKRKEAFSFGGWDFFEITNLSPNFSWEALPRPFDKFPEHSAKPDDVTYELRIYEGHKNGMFKIKLVYAVRDIKHSNYLFPRNLKPCSWYFWTVRARFKLDGITRVTEWGGTYDTELISYSTSSIRRGQHSLFTEGVRLHHFYYPFRTPADAANPGCWDTKLNK